MMYNTPPAGVSQLPAMLRDPVASARGLLVLGELSSPEDIAGAGRLASALGWPVVTDVLSGLRMAPPGAFGPHAPVLHHMDHVLLGGTSWWAGLRPSLVVQVGPRLTSKRLSQFIVSALGWPRCCMVPLGVAVCRVHYCCRLLSSTCGVDDACILTGLPLTQRRSGRPRTPPPGCSPASGCTWAKGRSGTTVPTW